MAWTIPANVVPGTAISATTTNAILADLSLIGGAMVAFTPTWTASTTNPTLGNGTLTGRFKQVDKMVDFTIDLTFGTTTTVGSGQYLFSLPVSAVRGVEKSILATLSLVHGVSRNSGGAVLVNTGVVRLMQSTAAVSEASPFAWASGDVISLAGRYEAA